MWKRKVSRTCDVKIYLTSLEWDRNKNLGLFRIVRQNDAMRFVELKFAKINT